MKRNVGMLERVARVVIGTMVLGLYGALTDPWKPFALLGLVLIATGVTGACPLHGMLGFSTRRREASPRGLDHAPALPHLPRSEDEDTWPPHKAPAWRPWDSTHGGPAARGG